MTRSEPQHICCSSRSSKNYSQELEDQQDELRLFVTPTQFSALPLHLDWVEDCGFVQPWTFEGDFEAPRQLLISIYLVPLFLTNCAFKVLSLAITTAEMKFIISNLPCRLRSATSA